MKRKRILFFSVLEILLTLSNVFLWVLPPFPAAHTQENADPQTERCAHIESTRATRRLPGELRDSSNDEQRTSVVSFEDQGSFGELVVLCGPEQDLNRLPWQGPAYRATTSPHDQAKVLARHTHTTEEYDDELTALTSFRAPSLGFEAWCQSRIPPSP